MPVTDHPIDDFSPSAKLVYAVLSYEEDALSSAEIESKSHLPAPTTLRALHTLTDDGVVESRPDPDEPRRQVYDLADGADL